MFNSGLKGKRTKDTVGILSTAEHFNQQQYLIPTVTSFSITDGSYVPTDDEAVDVAGGQTIVINGSGFAPGATVTVGGETISVVTFVDAERLAFTAPAKTSGSYNIFVTNTNGGTGILVPGLVYSGVPTFTTSAGSLATLYETQSVSTSVSATGDAPITYSLYSGTLPDGVTINSDGTITGTSPVDGSSTTYSFTIKASDAQNQDSTRSFSLTINTDVVSWLSPSSNGTTYSSYEYAPFSNVSLMATSAAGYSANNFGANTLPTGLTLSGNTIYGTVNTVGNTFTRLTATANTTGRSAVRDVIFNVNQDVVTWSAPGEGTAYTIAGGSAMSNVTLSSTSAAGFGVQYTANTLPSGVSLSGNIIYGTPDTAQTVNTLLTATANTTGRSSTRYISWSISLGDVYWKNTTLLLNGATSSNTFINDASLNNNMLTIAGDTKPNLFNPYREGYYSNYFDGTGDYLTVPGNAAFGFGTGDFTIEAWVYPASSTVKAIYADNGTTRITCSIFYVSGEMSFYDHTTTTVVSSSGANLTANSWHHIAWVRVSGVLKMFANGVQVYSAAKTSNFGTPTQELIGSNITFGDLYTGNISNLRIVKGTALYTSAFTPSTTPLTEVSGTQLLTCQSNRLIDNSINNFTITKNGDVTVSSAYPFPTPTTSSYNTQYSTYFDGTGDEITVPYSTNLNITSGDFTVECWVYLLSTSDGAIFNTYYDASTGWSLSFSAGKFYVNFTGDGIDINGSTGKTTGVWYHLAISGNASTGVKLFVNGVQEGTSYTGIISQNTSWPIRLGWLKNSISNYFIPLNGIISNFRIVKGTALYNNTFTPSTTPLTAVANTSLLTCQNSTLIDNSTNAFTITSAGDARPIAVSPFTMTTANNTVTSLGSAYFDGTGDYLQIAASPTLQLTGDFTVEAWCFPTVLNTNNMILGSDNGANSDYLNMTPSGLGMAINGGLTYPSWSYTFTTNRWYHIAVTRSGSNLNAYVNGIALGAQTYAQQFLQSGVGVQVGRYGYATNPWYFTGYITDLRIVKGTALYTANFLPPQTPLTPVANTQLLTCQTNGGATNNGFVDQSSFNNIITRSGNTTQGTFSPYSQNGWSNYFPATGGTSGTFGTGQYLLSGLSSNYALGTSNWTLECWYCPSSKSTLYPRIFQIGNGTGIWATNDFWALGDRHDSSPTKFYFACVGMGGNTLLITSSTTVQNGVWYHLALVRNGNTFTMYVNGTAEGTYTNAGSVSSSASCAAYIGSSGSSDSDLNGNISNLRLVKGQALYTGNFTPSTSPLTTNSVGTSGANVASSITGTVPLLTCQSNAFVDNSPTNITLTKNNNVSVQAFSPFGGVTSVPTSYSNYFDGTGDYLYTPSTSVYQFGTGDFTVECWVYMPVVTNTYSSEIVGTYNYYSVERGWAIGLTSAGVIQFGLLTSSGTGNWTVSGTTLPANKWNHIAAVRSGTTITIYLNGVSIATGTNANSDNFTGPIYIGTNASSIAIGLSTYSFAGYISNVRVTKGQALYTTAFTPSTTPLTTTSQGATAANVSLLTCQSATMVDNSTNYFALTANGNVKPRPFNPFGMTNTSQVSYTPSVNGGSMYFDGSGDRLFTSGTNLIVGTGDFTFECWIYPTAIGNNGVWVLSAAGSGLPGDNSGIYLHITATTINFSYGVAGSVDTTFVVNQWYHVAMVRSSGTLRIFKDGIQLTSVPSVTTNFSTQQYLSIGQTWDGNILFQGYMSDFRFVKSALYTSNFYPGAAPLTPTTTIGANTYSSSLHLTGTSGGIIDYHGTNDLETVGNTQLASEDPYSGSYYSNYFDGTGDYLYKSLSPSVSWTNTTFTLEAWVYPHSLSGDMCVFSTDNGNSRGLMFGIKTDGSLTTDNQADGASIGLSTGSAKVLIGKWNHIAITISGSTVTYFVNGILSGTSATGAYYNQTSASFKVGSTTTPGKIFNGQISNLRFVTGNTLYTTNFTPSTSPLTAVSGTTLLTCQSNKFIDNSTNNFTLTVTGDTKVKSMNPFQQNTGKSLYFDGTGDYLINTGTMPAIGTGDFTIECWFYPTSATTTTLIDFRPAATNGVYINLYMYTNRGMYLSVSSTDQINGGAGAPESWLVKLNSWNHIALSRSSGSTKLFVNGSQVGSTYTDTNNYLSPAGRPVIGGSGNSLGTYPVNGYISDFRITKGVGRYTGLFTPPSSTLSVK